MNSLVSILATIISIFLLAVVVKVSTRATEAEKQNKVLWEQIQRYEAYVQERAVEDEARQRMAILN